MFVFENLDEFEFLNYLFHLFLDYLLTNSDLKRFEF